MTTAYTSLLGLALPVTGELSGTWGDTVNNAITSLLDTAVAGTTSITTDADITLTTTTGASNQARQAIILWNPASGTTTRNITAPAQSKMYTVINATGGTQSIVLRGAGPTTGVTIVAGEKAVCAWNGSDFVKVGSTVANAGGSNTQVQFNSSGVLAGSANMTFNGTTLTVNDLTDSSLTTGRVVYTTTGGNLTSSANLLYSGTDLTVYGLTVGRGAGAVSTNTAVGASALSSNTTGSVNTAVGFGALESNTTGSNNVAVGLQSLRLNTTGGNNIASGYGALYANTTGGSNIGIGTDALAANTTASYNTAVGWQSGYSNTTGQFNLFVGVLAGNKNTTGVSNSFVGGASGTGDPVGYNNTTGNNNSGFGSGALYYNTTGSTNTATGVQALYNNTTASQNTAIGQRAGYNTTTAPSNVFIGSSAGYTNITGSYNTIIGDFAGYTLNNSATYGGNTLIGGQAGYALTTGVNNTFVGAMQATSAACGASVTTGSRNTILGGYSGNQDSLDIRTANNYVVLSDGSGNRQLSMYEGGTVALDNAVPVAGTGITFPATQSASSNANTLDDYEEGTWTPTLPNGGTLTDIGSHYTKIGRFVYVTVHLNNIAPTNNGSAFRIGGLPFTASASAGFYGGGSLNYVGDSNLNGYLPIIDNGSTYFFFHVSTGSTAIRTNSDYITAASGSTDSLIINATYMV